jgi:cell wall-associated NlpC family hydrolase
MNEGYYNWQKKFDGEYQAKTGAWDLNYLDFVNEKQQWIEDQYLYAVNVESAGLFDYTGNDAAGIVEQALAQLSVERMNREIFDPSLYTDTLLEDSIMGELLSHMSSLEGRGELGRPRVQTVVKRTSSAGDLVLASRILDEMNSDMRKAAAKLAAVDAQRIIEEAVRQLQNRLAVENRAVWEWEEHLVQANGYRTDGEIRRQAVVDSTAFENITVTQTVHRYQDYKPNSMPDAGVDLGAAAMQDFDADTIMRFVETARRNLDKWGEKIFGRLDDGERTMEHRIPRGYGELSAGAYAEIASAENGRVNNITAQMEKFESRGFESLSDDEKREYESLANQLVTVRDGELGAHIGYGPVLKDEVSYRRSPIDDALDRGAGEMGKIMLDFLWNSRVSAAGYQESFKALYDQKLWSGDSIPWLEAFTIRDVAGTAAGIGGMVSPAVGLIDDALFAAYDLGLGYQSPESVLMSLAVNAASTALSYGTASIGSLDIIKNLGAGVMKPVIDTFGKEASSILLMALGSTASAYTTAAAMNAARAYDFTSGNFDSSAFVKSLYSAETLSGAVSAFVGSGIGSLTGALSYADQKLYGGLVNLAAAGYSEAARYGVYAVDSLINGGGGFMDRLGQAYGNMGGITLNVANLGSILDLAGTISYRLGENYNTSLGDLGRLFAGAGFMELNLGLGGSSLSLGMGGIDLAGNLYNSAKHGLDYAALKYGGYGAGEDRERLIQNYLYGDWAAENTSMRINTGRDLLRVDRDGTLLQSGAYGYTARRTDAAGRLITIADTGNINSDAVILQHESRRDGYITSGNGAETVNAVSAHTQMVDRMLRDGLSLQANPLLIDDLIAYYSTGGGMAAFAKYALENYDSSRDYWKLMNDGTLVNDNSGWLVDEEGNPILNSADKPIGAPGIETGLLNILFGGTSNRAYGEFTYDQVMAAQNIMILSSMKFTEGASISVFDRIWSGNDEGIKLNMEYTMLYTSDTIAEAVFSKISPEVDRYAIDDVAPASINYFLHNSSTYTAILKKLSDPSSLNDIERIAAIRQLSVVNTESVAAYINDQLPPIEKASRKIYQKDYDNAQNRLSQLQGENSFGSLLAQAALLLAGGRYIYGAENPLYAAESGVDCSGAVLFAMRLMGYDLPRNTAHDTLTAFATKVAGEAQIGDINARIEGERIVHLQTLTGGTSRVDPYGGTLNSADNPASIKYFTTPIPSGHEVYRFDFSKIRDYYRPSMDIMSGKLTISQFNTAWEELLKYHY